MEERAGRPGGGGEGGACDDEAVAASAYARYDDTLRAYQAVDFDDLIALPIALLERDEAAAARWRERCGHLLVDEYQDTNAAQYRLLRLLAASARAFTAVGDDDQAIYGWRGASVENLAQLPLDYPALKVVKLEQNYRSTVRILRSANALIANNPKLFEKKLWSEHGTGDALRVTPAADDEAEAEGVVRRLLAHKFDHRGTLADYAILYRGNHQAKLFEQELRTQNVPYLLSGGESWFDRAEIKDLIAYLRLIANDDDDPAFIRAAASRSAASARPRSRSSGRSPRAPREPVRRGVRRGVAGGRGARPGSARSSTPSARWSTACAGAPSASRRAACSTSWSRRSATRTTWSRPATASRPRRGCRACATSRAGSPPRARPTARRWSSSRR